MTGDHDDHRPMLARALEHVEARHVGELEVEQHERRMLALDQGEDQGKPEAAYQLARRTPERLGEPEFDLLFGIAAVATTLPHRRRTNPTVHLAITSHLDRRRGG